MRAECASQPRYGNAAGARGARGLEGAWACAHGAARVARAVTPRTVSPLQCYMFHMYVGVRAGGGIGDEIEDPAGDEYEIYRIIFDITFFFFVIIILLAIIQGERRPR